MTESSFPTGQYDESTTDSFNQSNKGNITHTDEKGKLYLLRNKIEI